MEVIIKLSALVLFCLSITQADQCGNGICFSWSVSVEQLTLICKVGELRHRLYICDPSGKTRAYCIPPIPEEKCESYYTNSSIWQNVTTNETFFIIHEHIDYHVNGKWICKHGTGLETADVKVTVLMVKENVTMIQYQSKEDDTVPERYQCIKDSMLLTALAFILITALTLVLTSICGMNVTFFDDKLRKMSRCCCARIISSIKKVVFIATTLLFFCIVAFVAWDDTLCKRKWVFFACSLVVGFLSSFFFLSGDVQTGNRGQLIPGDNANGEEAVEHSVHLLPGGNANGEEAVEHSVHLLAGDNANGEEAVEHSVHLLPGGNANGEGTVEHSVHLLQGGNTNGEETVEQGGQLIPGGNANGEETDEQGGQLIPGGNANGEETVEHTV